MPYKETQKQKEANRLANKRYREKQKGITEQGITEEMFNGKPRYLTLSDGQVFDRTYQPVANKELQGMAACNRVTIINKEKAERYRLWMEGKAGGTDHMTAAKLLMVCQALDKQMPGLQGKENLLDMVRYGVSGPTMASVKASLGG